MTRQTARLENWSTGYGVCDPYTAPELVPLVLYGQVYNHPDPRNFDGKSVRTSTVISFDLEKRAASTTNTDYILGVPDPKWIEWMKKNPEKNAKFLKQLGY